MSALIGKTAARIAQQIRQVIAKANAELKKEGPPDPKKINELRKDYKALDNALPLAEEGEKLRRASQDKRPVMDRGGQGTTRSIGAGESSQSKGTTPFRKEASKKWFKVEEGIDEGRKSYGRKQAEAALENVVESDTSVPFKTGRSKEDDKAIKAFKGKTKKVRKGEATFKKPREKPSSVDKQKKAIVRQGKKELAKDPLNPNTSKVVRLREQYKTLNNLSNEVVDLVNESDLKKQATEANRLKKLVGRYTTTQINDIMNSSGDFSKGRSSGEFKSGSRGDGKYIPRSDEVGAPYPSPRANPEQVALKRKRPRKNRSQIIKKAQDAPVALQNLLVKLGIIKKSELKSSYVPKKTKAKPYKPKKPEVRKGKPRVVNGKTVETTQYRKKGGKVLKAKPKRKVTTVKRKTTAPRKRAALRGYGKALRGF